MSKEDIFRIFIRLVFLGAYGAFLWASLHHLAFFYASFEPRGTDTTGSYWLAISIDVTSLVMTIGVMFFRRGMSTFSFVMVWLFIIGLTVFSWAVNWEYAVEFQNSNLARATDFQWINPILASCFAFLNLVYSLVSEFFNTKPRSVADLDAEIARIEDMQEKQNRLRELKKGTGLIAKITEAAKDIQQAKSEIMAPKSSGDEQTNRPQIEQEALPNFDVIPTPQSEVNSPDPLETLENEISECLPEELAEIDSTQDASQAAARRKYYMTYQEASEYTGYQPSYLKGKVTAGIIKTSRDGSKLLVSSLDLLRRKQPEAKKETGELVAVKASDFSVEKHSNGVH